MPNSACIVVVCGHCPLPIAVADVHCQWVFPTRHCGNKRRHLSFLKKVFHKDGEDSPLFKSLLTQRLQVVTGAKLSLRFFEHVAVIARVARSGQWTWATGVGSGSGAMGDNDGEDNGQRQWAMAMCSGMQYQGSGNGRGRW